MNDYIYEFEIYTEADREPWYVTHNSQEFDEELEEFINDYGYSKDEVIYKVFNLKTEQYVQS
jgi:hypothetical protein